MNLIVALLIVICAFICNAQEGSIYINELPLNSKSTGFYTIEGRVFPAPNVSITPSWFTSTRIIVNYGQFLAFMRKDGSFEINQVPSGSYLVEVTNPDLFYKPTRVDINSKGKIRARKVNYIQSSAVQQISYPLKYRPQSPFKYFQTRETWRITDFLFNPMVLMMVLPLVLIMVLPKMMNAADVETQRELNNKQIPKYDVPELSEMMTNWFSGGASGLNKPESPGLKANKLLRKR
ncbi:ER membrane protein complex subunit 7 homolog [Tetranychus urticae]|uniref:ER membrane protein complex subunit 7 beta-sandwich domain-containing protein n=1 Tax=Tetranychus urticae TaxID=32264 RepID=T1JU01_TETUR|nr:ER membrane protein complex subunit 7 homolog [Tetranychus urticae]